MVQPVLSIDTSATDYEQIVVDIADMTAKIEPVLNEFAIVPQEIDRIAAFGIALIRIKALTDAQVDALPGAAAARAAIRAYTGATTETALDVLLRIIRDRYPADEAPQMGKNRDVDQLEALPHLGGGEDVPTQATADEFTLFDATTLRPPNVPRAPAGPKIGVLDSAMYPNAALQDRYASDSVVTDRPPRRAWEGHAAFVVGRILLRAPEADIAVRGVLDTNGMAKAWDVAYQMAALAEEVTILNMSMGCYTPDNEPPFLLKRAAERVTAKALLVAAAGNHGRGGAVALEEGPDGAHPVLLTGDPTAKVWPAALPGVIAVGAASECVSDAGVRLRPVDFTPRVDWVDVWAPGDRTVSTFLDGLAEAWVAQKDDQGKLTVTTMDLDAFAGYARWSGTSAATGDVTGEIARLTKGLTVDDAARAFEEIQRRLPISEVSNTDVRPSSGVETDWNTPPCS